MDKYNRCRSYRPHSPKQPQYDSPIGLPYQVAGFGFIRNAHQAAQVPSAADLFDVQPSQS